MDSIVDSFFPIMDFIEGESNEVDAFLSDPLSSGNQRPVGPKAAPSGVGVVAGRKVFDDTVVGIIIDEPSEDERKYIASDVSSGSVKHATVERLATTTVLRLLPNVHIPGGLLRLLPSSLVRETTRMFKTSMLVDHEGVELRTLAREKPVDGGLIPNELKPDDNLFSQTRFDRSIMLKRITDMRKLVTGLSRLLGPKMDVVRGLRKRTMEENLGLFKSDAKHDIAVYIGDLQGEPPLSLSLSLLSLAPQVATVNRGR